MADTPHRPFVAKSGGNERQTERAAADFRVTRPFVHGQARSYQASPPQIADAQPLASIRDFLAIETPEPAPEFLATEPPAPIADFLAAERPAVSPASWLSAQIPPRAESVELPASITDFLATESRFVPRQEPDVYEPPPMEHFIDNVSEQDTAVPDPNGDTLMDPFGAPTEEPQGDPHGWEETDWQRYDWRAAAALGDSGDPAASSAWAQTDWGTPASAARDSRDSAAKAIADALDGIARRIRDGDLVIPPPPASVPDPATIAATLAALLGVRR